MQRLSQYKETLLIVWVLLIALTSWGQSKPIFKKLDQIDGLSNARVTSIVKEKNGFVWIATKNGLNRYDGYDFKVFNKQNSSISSNDISDLLIDKKGRLWVTTLGGGVNIYNSEKNTFITYKSSVGDLNSLSSNQVNTIFEDSRGRIWLGTENGLCLFNETSNSFKRYTKDSLNKSISHNSVMAIYEDANNALWIGTFGGGLLKFSIQKEQFEKIESVDTFSAFVYTIAELNETTILVGTSGGGLLAVDINTNDFSDFLTDDLQFNKQINIVRSLLQGADGSIWVGTDGDGLIKITNANDKKPLVQNYLFNSQLKSSISGNAIYEIMEDEEANIWIGTAWNGINILNQEVNYEFVFSDIVGENPMPVLSVFKKRNKLFLGLDGGGLTIYDPTKSNIKYFNRENNTYLGGSYIQYITEGKEGSFWMGTFANGLINFNSRTGRYSQFKHQPQSENSLSYNDVRYIVEDEKKNLWIATWGGGLNYFDTEKEAFKRFREGENNDQTISSDNVISLQKDGTKMWIATFGGGLDLFDIPSQKFTHFVYDESNENSISSNNIFSIFKDTKGYLWIGTSGEGINRLNIETQNFERFPDQETIKYATVTAIIEDDNGVIWFSTKEGIFNYDYSTQKFNSFPNLAGEFHINAAYKDNSGELYFGGINGVLRFDPNTLNYEGKTPKVKLTNFKLFNKELAVGEKEILKKNIAFEDKITLKHNLDVITFEFAALQFPFSENNEYAIKMENFDEDWRNIGKDRTATFTNLAPGEYIFKVKSREVGRDWGEDYTQVKLKILKPFWLQWWALAIYVILIIGLFYLFRKYIVAWEQMKANLKLERLTHEKDTELYNLKQQFFTNISHEIRTPVTLILSAINRLVDKESTFKKEQLNAVKTAKKHGNHLLHLVNELLDFKNLEFQQIKLKVTVDNWVSFCEEIYLSFTEIALKKDIDLSFETTTSNIEVWFDKNQMEKVLYNLFTNALKFTDKGGFVKVEISQTGETAQLQIADSGIGIPKKQLTKIFNRFYQSSNSRLIEESGFGLGLSISEEIMHLHHGEINVQSESGKGSTFTIQLQKGKAHFDSAELVEDFNNSEIIANYFSNDRRERDLSNKVDSDFDLKNKTILIAEDNTDIRQYLVELLGSECQILEAENGKVAFDLVLKKSPDLIISDIMMPVMDGITLTRSLKTDMRTSHIPIILLTARGTFMHKREGYDTGADDYVTKPFNEALLRSRIKNLIRSRKILRERFNEETLLPSSDLQINQTDQKFLKSLVKAIEDNIDSETLNADFLSKELGMSHSVIYKKIKSLTGMTFIEFVRDYKLKIAKQLITEQSFSVSEACYKVGYSDRKYFSKLFKQRFGKNPSDFYSKS